MYRHSGKSLPRGEKMPAALEARSILQEAIGLLPRQPHDNKLSMLGKAAAALGLSFWQAKRINYKAIKTIDADKRDELRDRLNKLKQDASKRQGALHDLEARYADLRSARGSGDPFQGGGGAEPRR